MARSKRRRLASSPSPLADHSEYKQQTTDVDSTTPGGTQQTKPDLSDEQELYKAKSKHSNQLSVNYTYFDTPELSEHLDKHKRKMIAFPCKTCHTRIHRPTYDNSTTNLSKHVVVCNKKQQHQDDDTHNLVAVGINGTGNINPREVPQLCAIWCAEAARPFSALGEDTHRGILHPIVLKNLPTQKAVSRDIGKLYTAVQHLFIEQLKNHTGAMYLGLNAWQSPNGFNVLGTVIYRLVQGENGGFELDAMLLDFVRLKEQHTGVYLAETVRLIVEKFGVQDKTMIDEIRKYKWPRFKGKGQWVRCFAHILNLIVQVILRPFGSHKKKASSTSRDQQGDSDDEDDPDDAEDQIKLFNQEGGGGDEEDEDEPGNSTELAAELIADDEIKLENDDVNELSDKEETNRYTSESCKKTLAKVKSVLVLIHLVLS
ncbi:hypothetical protein Pst134EA_027039 [Puccinia striiformis f. sp. tritici]|uniref:hypothetical protein n=1 Tax=Puccinia striiformis f. sp. tritici TaxID=168172 RepID=UPI002007FB90|nr:hypothetical protein Pst134EA_027039 [Puccinia striiformis f. sp. tritici]KAH9450330.1 hypothetical protein Pst134EA_027039 [Puccinia striiformis f. sp. tritici]